MRPSTDQTESCFVFREAVTLSEMLALFRLRYRVYRSGRLARFVPENDVCLDVDAFDVCARHFGVFHCQDSTQEIVGGIRVVEDRPVIDPQQVDRLLKAVPQLRELLATVRECPFPLMEYSPDAHRIERFYEQLRQQGADLAELGRFVVDNEYRSLRMARVIFESCLAVYYYCRNVSSLMACCDTSKKAFYAHYGVHAMPHTIESDFTGIGRSSSCVLGQEAAVPDSVKARLVSQAHQYQKAGQLLFSHSLRPVTWDRAEGLRANGKANLRGAKSLAA